MICHKNIQDTITLYSNSSFIICRIEEKTIYLHQKIFIWNKMGKDAKHFAYKNMINSLGCVLHESPSFDNTMERTLYLTFYSQQLSLFWTQIKSIHTHTHIPYTNDKFIISMTFFSIDIQTEKTKKNEENLANKRKAKMLS